MATRLKKAIADQPGAETLASSAYERLRFDIISGVFPPEAKLLIRQLCARYEIGLSPIREALNRVSRDGLVKHHEQRGFTVTAVTEADLEDITKARCWANEVALRESIANGDQGWEEAILIAFHRMSRLQGPAEQADHPVDAAWERAHRAFHTSLISACGSSWLIGFCEQLFDAADRYRFLARLQFRGRTQRQNEHRDIMEAVLRRDADQAVQLLLDHFRATLNYSRIEIHRLNGAPEHSRATMVLSRKQKSKKKGLPLPAPGSVGPPRSNRSR